MHVMQVVKVFVLSDITYMSKNIQNVRLALICLIGGTEDYLERKNYVLLSGVASLSNLVYNLVYDLYS